MPKLQTSLSAETLERASLTVVVTLLFGFAVVGPLPQGPYYHQPLDTRMLVNGIPHTLNVLSWLVFLGSGLLGLFLAGQTASPQRSSLGLFATGLVLTGLGGAFYNLSPDNSALIWVRVPMALAYAGAIGAMAAQYLGPGAAARWQQALLYLGQIAVAYWSITGDMRLLYASQFGGLALGVLWSLSRRPPDENITPLPWAWLWVAYGLAKVSLVLDSQIWGWTHELVSGHALKPIFAAAGTLPLWYVLWQSSKKSKAGS